ncbi:hypothetical protein H072_7381 [Dactylellina haptotyla CBS 200.50]|uniref:Peptidase S8/S53 domain-containing protein n=1 Tax=Dactylellina haptotyla (strain CBS 200.50) TaxID=1284197 RepID=S8ACS3_DACHA|nr:hypothetical protein H072_7381 [Dactylellina haptotyla CBS 200.50]
MKSVALVSTSLLLASISTAIAIPSGNINSRWLKKDTKSGPPASVADHGGDHDDYLVVLADNETRPWNKIFADMGWNTTESVSTLSNDNGIVGYRSFKTESGSNIKTFGSNMRAFTVSMKKSQGVSMQSLPNVAIMEKNYKRKWAVMPRRSNHQARDLRSRSPLYKRQNLGNQTSTFIEQSTAPWNLQRVSSKNAAAASQKQVVDLAYKYRFDSVAGMGVDVYLVDSGFNIEHTDFGGRAKVIFSPSEDGGRDNNGHGTHTSGTVGSLTYGVAKKVNIFGAKAGDEAPTDSAIVAGLDRALSLHLERMNQTGFMGSVISMSLGGPDLGQALFSVLQRAMQAGMHVSIAAGNDNKDACTDFPGAFSQQMPLINVGATDINDARATFSNFGPCVDIHAPGVGIVSTWKDGPTSIEAIDGTSMACPAVTGMIAYELALNPQFKLDPQGMKQHILSKALPNSIRGAENVPDGGKVLLNNGFPGDPLR